MGKKIVRFHVSVVLTVLALAPTLSLLFLFSVGFTVSLFVEMFKFYSRVSISELAKYKICKPVEKNSLNLANEKIFKLPLPEEVNGNGVVMSPINEKKLSKVSANS